LFNKKEDGLIAVASDTEIDAGVPCFDINDVKSIADFIERGYLL